ncbi:hypothetical protein AVEN_110486-1 [Araneus ventricosus]|uniref:Uncharacterized protein n=1 Tax=Araneus ventricosus TaxID=182803 RepID=A0A4Y2PRR3_ARAVE|nr:hypothetical protein AVEN_110486-1 [Araneus ventricosus]
MNSGNECVNQQHHLSHFARFYKRNRRQCEELPEKSLPTSFGERCLRRRSDPHDKEVLDRRPDRKARLPSPQVHHPKAEQVIRPTYTKRSQS